ncbi:ribosomal protection-like ABC-F family protein [Lactobacillus kalixensis]|uniref:ABC transporter domain-containing protein n=1 Tax=Lactobacillus kalixensis DSM 16043 TaxID=1423763 RepID=A0A0R1UHV0_9LACO|nr:ATP-binding cassette domain-containing protein [Lactobacillus kalixensis]KRL90258.1 hypothetical protein FC46_GL000269 [Lactobacillus kalixensis DSM 16043]
MSNIKVINLSFGYEDASGNIFNNLNLDLDSSWKLGLVGRNGRGKTTFLNLLRGKLRGLGEIRTDLTFSYFPLEVNDPQNIALYELQEQLDFQQWQLEKELRLMGVNPDLLWQPFATLSGGEQTKVLLATSFLEEDSFPLIDEPTNHLDEHSRFQIADYLKKHDKGYIVVSHDRDFLNQVTDHVLAIENTEIHLYQGNYASYEGTKDRRDQFNRDKNAKLKGEIKQLNKTYVQFNNWSDSIEAQKYSGMKTQHVLNRRTRLNKGAIGHAAAKMMKKAINTRNRIDKRIDEKENLMVNIEDVPSLEMNFEKNYHSTLFEVRDFGLKIGDKQLFSDLTLIMQNQGVVALEGDNGSGKTTLLKYLLSRQEGTTHQGSIEKIQGLRISYLPQGFTEYTGDLKAFSAKHKISYEELLNNLKKMGFPRSDFNTPIEKMSMGQQKRVALAKSLVEPADLYFWDEPANYLDVFNQDQLVKLLKEKQPAMLLIEHDQHFISEVAKTRIKI